MDLLTLIEITAAIAGLVLAVMITLFPRFGSASWTLLLFLVPGFMASAVLGLAGLTNWPIDQTGLLAFSFLLLCGAGGFLASYALEREDYSRQFKKHRWFFAAITLSAPALVVSLYLVQPLPTEASEALQVVQFGPVGYGAALYLLLVSVVALANVEQTLRGAEEHVRWEVKFLLLGLASLLGALVYVASTVLLYAPANANLTVQTLRIFPALFFCSSVLILQSWRRATRRSHVIVSQGVIYSTITLFTVGIYLIVSSLVARWAGERFHPGIPVGPIIFLVSAVGLSIVLLGTTFRHRTRRWIRRNVFVGGYDYRMFWIDATERVQSIDSPPVAAAALAELIENALGSLDTSVWLRSPNSDKLVLVAKRGSSASSLRPEANDLMEPLTSLHEPVSVSDLDESAKQAWPVEFLEQTKASILAPLLSSGRIVGLLTIGSDRSGKPFDREAREFVRVLALHSAGEFHKSELLATLVATREAEAFRTFSTFLLHDLKNFASTLSLIAKNATRHHGNPDFQLDAFHSILDTSEKMKKLCNSLRTFSTALATNRRLQDLNEIARSVAETFDAAGPSKYLQIELGELPPVVVDREEIVRVLQNLVLNAREASAEGTIQLATKLEDKTVVITVSDRGKGIPRQFMEHELFQPFHTTKGDGLGIGLFQSKKIVEAHGGTIDVKSIEGEGTVVRVTLPLTPDARPQTATTGQRNAYDVLVKAQIAN